MSKAQPGSGYGFTSSGYGFSLNTEKPFASTNGIKACQPLRVNYDSYESSGNTHFFNVCVGAVNNLIPQVEEDGVWVLLNRVTSGIPNPPKSVINVTAGLGIIYLRCGATDGSSPSYPSSDPGDAKYPRIISAGGSIVPSDTNTNSYLLLATVLIDSGENATISPVVFNSIWTERFKCGSSDASYWWSTV